jgi:plastocyanin
MYGVRVEPLQEVHSMTTTRFNDTLTPQKRRVDRRAFLGLGAASLVGAGAIAIGGGHIFAQEGTPGAESSPGASPSASPAASPAADGAAPVVHTVDLAFEPKEFTIKANTDVEVMIENHGQLQHDFYIDDLGIQSDLIDAGKSTTVTINAAPGTYEYYCSVTGHKQAGMVGKLTVQ